MEYIDRQQDIVITPTVYNELMALKWYLIDNAPIADYNVKALHKAGLRRETFTDSKHKDLPIEWVIALYM